MELSIPNLEGPPFYRLLAAFFIAFSFCTKVAFLESKARHLSLTLWHHGHDSSKSKWYFDIAVDMGYKTLHVLNEIPIALAILFLLNSGILPCLWKWAGKPCSSLKSRPILVEILQSTAFVSLLAVVGLGICLPFQIPRCFLGSGGIYGPTVTLIYTNLGVLGGAVANLVLGLIPASILVGLWHLSPYCLPFSIILSKLVWEICRDAWDYFGVTRASNVFKHLSPSSNLDTQISQLANRLGFPVDRIFVSTDSCRDSVTFVSGPLSFFKRIIIDSSFYKNSSEKAVMALVAREIGHWYMYHEYKKVLAELLLTLTCATLFCFLAFRPTMYSAFGFKSPNQQQQDPKDIELESRTVGSGGRKRAWYNPNLMPIYIALLLFVPLQLPIMDLTRYTLNAINIHQHYSVDRFAVAQGYKEGLIEGIKLYAKKEYEGEHDKWIEYCTMEVPNVLNRLDAVATY